MSGGRNSFAVDGKTFTVPSPAAGVRPEDRLAPGFYAGGRVPFGRDLVSYSLSPGAVDLSLVRTGRAPLLVEHTRSVDCLLGAVVGAESDGALLRSLVRFARGREADRLYGMLCDGFPLSLSFGARILNAERVGDAPDGGGGVYRVDRWRLTEVSVCVFGREEAAHLRCLGEDEDAAALVARMRAAGHGEPRAAVRRALHLDRWRTWAKVAGPRLAVGLGLAADPVPVCDALEAQVAEHCDAIERDLAA